MINEAKLSLWVPGEGNIEVGVASAAKAVREYDPDLKLARHTHTGEWVVFLERGLNGEPYPVFGLGNSLPSPDEIQRRLGAADVRRHGRRILASVMESNARRQGAKQKAVDEGSEIVAERLEFEYRRSQAGERARLVQPVTDTHRTRRER